jgi:endoglucanase
MKRHFQLGLVCAGLCLMSLAAISAQTPSVLNTAPGTGPSSNAAPIMVQPALVVPAGTSLLSNGDFELATQDPGWPDDWDRSEGGAIAWKSEEGKHFLSLVSQHPQQHVQLYRIVDLPAGVTGLEFSARYRVADLKSGRFPEDKAGVILEFLDAKVKPIAAASPVSFAADSMDWTKITERMAVPPGALHLAIMPCLYRVDSGELDLAEIRVTTLNEADAALIAAEAAPAAARKRAAETVILDHEIAAPAKTLAVHASGNRLVDGQDRIVWLQGVNVGNLSIRSDEEHKILWAVHVALTDWNANVIRLPVLDRFWFGKGRGETTGNDAEAYRAIVDKVIKIAAGKGAYVVFDLHRYLTPDASCVVFWKNAAARYKDNPAVLFDILNEPHDTSWEVWRNGGPVELKGKTPATIQSVGMQALVDAVRGTGAKNLIVAGGLGYAFDLSGIVNGYALDDKGGDGIMYATHFYNWHGNWAKHILGTAEKYPVLVGEVGADINKMNFIPANKQEDPYTWVPDAIGFIQKNHLNWTAWCFHTRATPDLLLDWEYDTPTPFWGAFVKDALHGQQYEMKRER